MPRFTYNGVTVEVSDETAALLSSDYQPVEEKTTKTTAKKAASAKNDK